MHGVRTGTSKADTGVRSRQYLPASDRYVRALTSVIIQITSVPKVIWEQGRVFDDSIFSHSREI